jgi:hypothetical protein
LLVDDVSVEVELVVDVLVVVVSEVEVCKVVTICSGASSSSVEHAIKTNINEEQKKLIEAVLLAF